jgi:hypothetical protein
MAAVRSLSASEESDRLVRVDSYIERPVSATSRYGCFAVQSVYLKDAPRLSVVERRPKYDALGSRFQILSSRGGPRRTTRSLGLEVPNNHKRV